MTPNLFLEVNTQLGGLFSLHTSGAVLTSQDTPVVKDCSSLQVNLVGYRHFHVMRFALEEINNSSTFLPNIKLGYEVSDICYIYNSVHPALEFMSKDDVLYTEGNITGYIPKVIAVVGPDSGDAADITADLFNLLHIPQMNFHGTSRRMSELKLPSCFQTTSSRRMQQQAIIDILTFFNWTWIAVLGSSEDYGHHGVLHFLDSISALNICVAYKGMIPIKMPGKENQWENAILNIVNNISVTNVNVIVVFSSDVIALDFFKKVIESKLSRKIWVATESWSLAKDIYNLPNINTIGVFLGTAAKYVNISRLDQYLMDVYHQDHNNSGEGSCNQNCANTTLSDLVWFKEERVSFSVYAAVHAVANALHIVLGCNETYCYKRDVFPWQVTDALRKVNFSLLGNPINFDQYGDLPIGYDIVFWNWWGTAPFEKVGAYEEMKKIYINAEKINWQSTYNLVPSSVCSAECLPGQEKVQMGRDKCCFSCVSCAAGTYLDVNGTCVKCNTDQWSNESSTFCLNKTRAFLKWTDNGTIAIFVMTILGMVLNILVILTFVFHLSSPVVKAAGGKMCFLMLTALTAAYLSILSYLGEPSTLKCSMRHPGYNLTLSICFSYISVRSFQIVCIFKMAANLPATYNYWVKKNGQYICVAVLSGVQVLITCVWVITNPPTLSVKNLDLDQILLDCSQFGSVYNIFQYVYNAFLSLLCFSFAYMGKELPKNYNEAKCITFAMLIYFVACISFFTAQLIDVGEYFTAVNAALALVSLYGVTGGYFFPKCYIIFFKPQYNTMKHFQSTIQSYNKRGNGSTK
ncbi:taste receptor type 1 member 2-like [Rhinophrynus dorsalis]